MSDLTNDLVIDDDNFEEHTGDGQSVVIDGETKRFGAVERDYSKHPVGSYGNVEPFNMPLIPRSEWSSRIEDMEQSGTRLSDLRMTGAGGQPIESLDQNGQGYCWAYSPGSALLLARARDNQPYVRFSPHAVACVIKNFRDQGGWNPQAVEFAINRGYPTVRTWQEKSMRRENNNEQTWQEAAKYKVTEGFMDLNPPVYDRNLSFDQFMTCLLCRIPCPADFMWWRHSVCACDPVEVDSSLPLLDIRRWGVRIWNSWRDSWGTLGMGVLRGERAVPDGATAIKGVTNSY